MVWTKKEDNRYISKCLCIFVGMFDKINGLTMYEMWTYTSQGYGEGYSK